MKQRWVEHLIKAWDTFIEDFFSLFLKRVGST